MATVTPHSVETKDTSLFKIIAAFAVIYVVWGTTYLAIALSIQTLPPFTSGAVRFLLAGALMYGWLKTRESRPFAGVDLKRAALCGVLLTGFGNGLVVWAQQGVPSGIAALIVAAIPIFVLLLEFCFFGGALPRARVALGMLVALGGVMVIVTHTHDLSGAAQPMYVVAILAAVLAWSLGTLFQRQAKVPSDRVFAFTCAQIFFGGLLQLSLAIAGSEWTLLDVAKISLTSSFAVLYLIVFGSIVALSCYSWLLTKVAPQKVATYALVNPVVALLLGSLVLGEKITALTIFGAAAVLLGIGLVLMPKFRSPAVKPRLTGEAA